MILLVIRRRLVCVDHAVNELQDLERLLAAVLGQSHQKVRSRDIWSRDFLVEIEFPVQILLGLVLKPLDIVLRQAQDGEDEVGDEIGQMGSQVCPHLLRADTLVHEDDSV